MTAEEYLKHYASGQGGYESVSVDIALRAIEYAKRETEQQMMAKAIVTTVVESYGSEKVNDEWRNVVTPKIVIYDNSLVLGDKVKVIVIKKN